MRRAWRCSSRWLSKPAQAAAMRGEGGGRGGVGVGWGGAPRAVLEAPLSPLAHRTFP